KPPILVSASQERDVDQNKYVGGVRLWDAKGGKELARHVELPDPGARRPGLAAWHTGPKPTQIAVALAWRDGYFRVWDVAGRGTMWRVEDGERNEPLALLADQEKVLTGSFRKQGGTLQLWDVQDLRMEEGRSLLFGTEKDSTIYLPQSLTVFSSRGGQS